MTTRKDKLIIKRLGECLPLDQTVDVHLRAPTSVGAPLVATIQVSLNATLADVRTIIVRNAMSSADSEKKSSPPVDYPLDLSQPFRFVRRGGLGTVRAAAESRLTVASALPLAPRYGLPRAEFSPRFQFIPPCPTVIVSRSRTSTGNEQKPCEAVACLFIVGETKDGFPRGIDELLGSRMALHLEGVGRQPTAKQLATLLTKRNCNVYDLLGRTLLHDAAADGNTSIVTFLLSLSFIDKGRSDARGETALHVAARRGHLDVCAALMDAGIDALTPSTAFHSNPGETPLHVALHRRFDTVVDAMCRQLRRRGVSVDDLSKAVDTFGFSPLTLFSELSPSLALLLEEGNLAASQALYAHLLHPRSKLTTVSDDGTTALHSAAASGNAGVVRFVVDEWSRCGMLDLVMKQDPFGRTALHVASALGAVDAALVLQKAGCLASTADRSGRNALHIAAYNKRWELLEKLCQANDAATALGAFDVAGLTVMHIVAGDAPVEVVNAVAPFGVAAIDARANLEKMMSVPRSQTNVPPLATRRHDFIRFRKVLRMKYSDLADIRQRRKAAVSSIKQLRDKAVYVVKGPSPLWCAVHSADGTFIRNSRSTEVVAALLRFGAGRTEEESSSTLLSLIGHALFTCCYDSANQLMKLVRADAVAREHRLLTAACQRGDAVAVRWLVDRGVGTAVDWSAEDLQGIESPFAACCKTGNATLLAFLLQTAHLSPPPSTLQLAVTLNQTALVRELLRAGVKAAGLITLDSPLSIAAANGYDEVLQSLLGYGASPIAHDRNGVPALWLSLHNCTAALRRCSTHTAPFDRAAAALVRAGTPLCGESGVYHPLEVLSLACSNQLWCCAEAIIDTLSILPEAERAAMISSWKSPMGRNFRETTPPPKEGIQRRTTRNPARWKCLVPTGTAFDASTPKHTADRRIAASYLAAASFDAKPRELLIRLLTDVRLPFPATELTPWITRGDARGWSVADHAFASGSLEAALLVAAAGSFPLQRHHCQPGSQLQLLQQAMHAARREQERGSPLSNTTCIFVEILQSASPSLSSAYIQATRRIMLPNDFDAWCCGDSLIAAIRYGQPSIVAALLERTASLDVGSKPALALSTAMLRELMRPPTKSRGTKETAHRLDMVAVIFEVWPRKSVDRMDAWWIAGNSLTRDEWRFLCSEVGSRAIESLKWSRSAAIPLLGICAALRNTAVVSGLIHRDARFADGLKASNAALASLVSNCDRPGRDVNGAVWISKQLLLNDILPTNLASWVGLAKKAVQHVNGTELVHGALAALSNVAPVEATRAILEGANSLLSVCAKSGAVSALSRLLEICPSSADVYDAMKSEDAAVAIRNPLRDALQHAQDVCSALLFAYGFKCGHYAESGMKAESTQARRCRVLERYHKVAHNGEPLVFVSARLGDIDTVQWYLSEILHHTDIAQAARERLLPPTFAHEGVSLVTAVLPGLQATSPEVRLALRRSFESPGLACSSEALLSSLCSARNRSDRLGIIDWVQHVSQCDWNGAVNIARLTSAAALSVKRIFAKTRFSVVEITPIALAVCLADVDLLQALLSLGCKPNCMETKLTVQRSRQIKKGVEYDADSQYNVSVMNLATRIACCSTRHAQVQRALSIVAILADNGALAADSRDVSSVIMALAAAGHWVTVDALLEMGAAAAISSAPSEVGARARRFIVRVDSASEAPLLLRPFIKRSRHLMQIAAAADLPRERLLHIAKHCSRADVESSTDEKGRTALYHAAARLNPSSVVLDVLLSVDFSSLAICDTKRGLTPLMVAAMHGNLVGMSRIITSPSGKSSIDALDHEGRTALMHAAMRGHESVVELLIELGADRSVLSTTGWNATLLAIENGHRRLAMTLVKHWSTIADLTTPLTTAMHCAARSGMHELIDVLCKMASINPMNLLLSQRDKVTQHTALFLARAFGHGPVLRSMLSFVATHEEELQDGAATPDEDAEAVLSATSRTWTFGWLRDAMRLSELIERRAEAAASAPGAVGRASHRPGEVNVSASVISPLRPFLIRHDGARKRARRLPLLKWGAGTGNLVVLRALSDLNVLDDCFALHAAAAGNHVEACRMLIALRVSEVLTPDSEGHTPLWHAARNRAADAFGFLLSQCAIVDSLENILFCGSAMLTKKRGPSNLLHEIAGSSRCAAVFMDAINRSGPDVVSKPAFKRALEAKDPSGFTPFEVALALGCPSAAIRLAMASSAESHAAGPLASPVDRETLLRLPSVSPSIRALLFDGFKIPEALTMGDAPVPLVANNEDDDSGAESNDDTHSSSQAQQVVPATPSQVSSGLARLSAPDLRCVGLTMLEEDPHIGRAFLSKFDVEHERTYAFRELVQSLSIPLRIHFLFDSLSRLDIHVQLFIVRRLSTSALLGRLRDIRAESPPGSVQSVSLEFVPNRDDAKVSIRGSDIVDAFSWSEGVLVAGSAPEACERAFATHAHRLLSEISLLEDGATSACRKAAENHPVLRHIRFVVDTGRELERTDRVGREAIRNACARALDSASSCFRTLSESVLTGITAPQLHAVVKVQTGLDASAMPATTPTVHLVFIPRERPAARGREILPQTDTSKRGAAVPATLVLHFDERGLTVARCRHPIDDTFGAVMKADAATVRVHLLRDAFVSNKFPRALNPVDPKAAPTLKVRFEMETGCTVADVEPRALAESFAAVSRAFFSLSSGDTHRRHSATRLMASALKEGYFKTLHITFMKKSKVQRIPTVSCRDAKLSLIVTPDGGPHTEDVCTAVQEAVAQSLITKLREGLPSVASDAAHRLHTYLPHANLNVDIASITTAYSSSLDQLEALEVLAHKRGSLVLLPLVQALSVGWDSRIGSAIRSLVRTVHVAATRTRPSSFDILADGNAVYLFNPLTPIPVNGGVSTRSRTGVGLLGAQALASMLIMAAVKDLVDAVDETAAFACWSRIYVIHGRLQARRASLKIAIEPRNVFNQLCHTAKSSTEPFVATLSYRGVGGQSQTLNVVMYKSQKRYTGRVDVSKVTVPRMLLRGTLHGQPLLGSPQLIGFSAGDVYLPNTQLKLPFDSLVVGRPAFATLVLRDAAGVPLLRGPEKSRFVVEGPQAGDVIVLTHQVCGNGTIAVQLMPRRVQLGAAVLVRIVDTQDSRAVPQPLSAAVDVLSDVQYDGFIEWLAGRSRDENAKRRADRIARYFRTATRTAVAQKLASDADKMGAGIARVDRRFPKEYKRPSPRTIRPSKGTNNNKKPPLGRPQDKLSAKPS